MAKRDRAYWVVSPNVKNNNRSVGEWRQASIETRAAFMGWNPDDAEHLQIGPKFAGKVPGGIEPGDVILIARRSGGTPEVVGFGVVDGAARTRLPGFALPDYFGSLRMLKPFVPWSRPPTDVPFDAAVRHVMALARLHPESKQAHKEICRWMEKHIERRSPSRRVDHPTGAAGNASTSANGVDSRVISIVDSPQNHQLDYAVRTEASVRQAQKVEARLLKRYKEWLSAQERKLDSVKYRGLQCDGYEETRRNLIEAKSSVRREHVRMAVGQLLDYAFQGRSSLGDPNKAVLLPERPSRDLEEWLTSLNIKLIWPTGDVFVDNTNGQFT